MSQGHNKHYCLLTDRFENTVVFWATNYCLLTDRLLSYDRPVMLMKSNRSKTAREVFSIANHIYNLYITLQAVHNSREALL